MEAVNSSYSYGSSSCSVTMNSSDLTYLNWTSTVEPFRFHYSRPTTVTVGVFAVLFCILGVVGNIITVLAILKDRKLRQKSSSYFILSLCLSDFLFCLLGLPLQASRYLRDEWVHGDGACRFLSFVIYTTVFTSTINVMALTINRYVLIVHPSKYREIFTTRNSLIMIALVWIITAGFQLPPLFSLWGEHGFNSVRLICTLLEREGKSPKKFYFIVFNLIPCLIMTVCYVAICLRVRRSRKRMEAFRPARKEEKGVSSSFLKIRKKDLQMSKMILLVFVNVLLCYVVIMFMSLTGFDAKYSAAYFTAIILLWSSFSSNLVIYAVFNRQYRKAYINLFKSIYSNAEGGMASKTGPEDDTGYGSNHARLQESSV